MAAVPAAMAGAEGYHSSSSRVPVETDGSVTRVVSPDPYTHYVP